MLKKASIGKGVSTVLVISMFGMGAPSIPLAYASGEGISSQSTVQNEPISSLNVLSDLEIQGVTMDQPFSPDLYQYTATVESNVPSVTLLVKSDNEKSKITVNGQTVNDDGTTNPIPLQTGENQIVITVDDGVNKAVSYNLVLTKKKSSNNLLQDLQLSTGELSPKFDPAVAAYTVQEGNEVSDITLTPVPADKSESIKVNDTPVTDKGVTVQLQNGKTSIAIVVTAENGDQRAYTVEVTKAVSSTNSSASSGTTQGASNNNANKKLAGLSYLQNTSTAAKSVFAGRSGSSSQQQGSQQQGSQQGGTAVQQPSKATLSSLTVTSGTWNNTFTKDTYTYHIAVGSDINTIAISSSPTYSGSSVSVEGSTNNTIILGNAAKTIVPVVVTNGDERKTYILVFDKTVPQADVATAVSQTSASTENTAADTSIKDTTKTAATNNWNGGNNNQSTSFWSRLIDSIRSFFSKL